MSADVSQFTDPQKVIPPRPPIPLFEQFDLSFGTLTAIGACAYRAAEFGEIATVVKRINDRGAGPLAYLEEYERQADRTAELAAAEEKAGHLLTARDAYLRSASYRAQALFYALARAGRDELEVAAGGGAMPAAARALERAVYDAMRESWERAGALMTPAMECVAVEWDGGPPMPAWFMRPAEDDRRRPTVLFVNGSDGQAVEMWGAGIAAALERGWNALVFDGPGQGELLYRHDVGFAWEWERAVTPMVDWLVARQDVDEDAIFTHGWSFAGYLVTRAIAFEPRIRAASVDSGVVNAGISWSAALRDYPEVMELYRTGRTDEFSRAWSGFTVAMPYEQQLAMAKRLEIYAGETFAEKYAETERFDNGAVAGRITCPVLVADNEVEQFFPDQPRALYDALTGSEGKRYVRYTVEDGAQYHCEPMAPQRRNATVMDFFADVIA